VSARASGRSRAFALAGPSRPLNAAKQDPYRYFEDATRRIRRIGEDHLDAEIVRSIPNREQSPQTRGIDEGEIGEVEDQPVNIVCRQQVLKR
jgi:hypothetical protein